jgi:hypothetical protein
MHYNERLLEGIPPDKRELAELIIYMVYRQIDYKKYFNSEDTIIRFDGTMESEVNLLVEKLVERKILEPTYPDNGVYRLELTKPLLVSEDISETQFDAIRQMWNSTNTGKVGWMSDKRESKERFEEWRKENPQYSYQQIYKACDYYINNTEMIHKFYNFIDQVLSSVLEDMETKKADARTSNFI